MENPLPVNNLETHRLEVVVRFGVDLDTAKNHDQAVIGASLRYLEDIVANVLIQHACCLCNWFSLSIYTLSLVPDDVPDVLHLGVEAHQINSGSFR